MNIAYIRVSSEDQKLDRQRELLKDYGIEKWFEEKISGKDTERPVLQKMLEFIREGDTVYITDFSRLARSVKDLLDLTDRIHEKEAELVSVKEKIDTNTPVGKMMLTVIGAIAEFERAVIRERQMEGIALAKKKGIYAGRKPKPVKGFEDEYALFMTRKITLVEMARRLGVSRSTMYRIIAKHKENTNRNTERSYN